MPRCHPSVQSGEHLDDADQERAGLPTNWSRNQPSAEHDVDDGGTLRRAAASDRVEASLEPSRVRGSGPLP